jgi:8-oxo-dGTP pyrophosphatase MutT (NUDIX family)
VTRHTGPDPRGNNGDIRELIRAELMAIDAVDVLEQDHLADALAWLDSGADLFRTSKPAVPPKHLVSYFAVVDENRLLLVDHKNAGLWLPPGGHVEMGEHPRATVVRELDEELGVRANHDIGAPLMLTCTTTVGLTAGHTDVSLWYVVQVSSAQVIRFDQAEFNSVRWFHLSEIPFERSDPHLRGFVARGINLSDWNRMPNIQMEPTRQLSSAIMSPRRAAHLAR